MWRSMMFMIAFLKGMLGMLNANVENLDIFQIMGFIDVSDNQGPISVTLL